MTKLTSVEICAGAGGQALGLEQAGFQHEALVEIDKHCCATLRFNRPRWNVVHGDITEFNGRPYRGVDLLAGGVPCPPFSVAGKQLGQADERNLFPEAIRLVSEIRPKAVLLENVKGLKETAFDEYRLSISKAIERLGYSTDWRLLNASDYGVSQLRPRLLFVAVRDDLAEQFKWPDPEQEQPITVGERLLDLIAVHGWKGAAAWSKTANTIAPTVVGGSHKHGGPDLGPTRARQAWALLGVDGLGIADDAPERDFIGTPRLTVRMVARIQGFPDSWQFAGGKTAAYRQVGNAFPPPVACAIGQQLFQCLTEKNVQYAT
jgi:DNA (cytosine-5)-methyltransferase 1